MLMKLCFTLIAVLANLQAIYAGGPQEFTRAPTIKLQQQKVIYRLGESVIFNVSLINTTNKEVLIFKVPGATSAEIFYQVVGYESGGKPLKRSSYGEWLQNGPVVPLSRILKSIQPGQRLSESMDVSKVYDLTKTGTYNFKVERLNPLDDTERIKSNTVTVEIK